MTQIFLCITANDKTKPRVGLSVKGSACIIAALLRPRLRQNNPGREEASSSTRESRLVIAFLILLRLRECTSLYRYIFLHFELREDTLLLSRNYRGRLVNLNISITISERRNEVSPTSLRPETTVKQRSSTR